MVMMEVCSGWFGDKTGERASAIIKDIEPLSSSLNKIGEAGE